LIKKIVLPKALLPVFYQHRNNKAAKTITETNPGDAFIARCGYGGGEEMVWRGPSLLGIICAEAALSFPSPW
jgi:hypothetical protein